MDIIYKLTLSYTYLYNNALIDNFIDLGLFSTEDKAFEAMAEFEPKYPQVEEMLAEQGYDVKYSTVYVEPVRLNKMIEF